MDEDTGDPREPDAGDSLRSAGSGASNRARDREGGGNFRTPAADANVEDTATGVRVGSVGASRGRDADPVAETRPASAAGGKVYLVGSGPGDPGLLTRKAWRLLERADSVLHDSLVSDDVLGELPTSVEIIDVGKRPPDRTSQEEINDMLVDRSRDGETVVRLKGGDPHVFGRGGEEAQHLAAADVPFEVVPGVSSAVAAPGVAGIPLTHRERASSVTVVTGHETPDKDESALDWGALADTVRCGGTLVILMGVRRLPNNVEALRDHGVPAETPIAMVQKATWSDEQTVTGTLDTIVERRDSAGIEPPAVTVVGDVVGVRGETNEWLDR